MKGLVIGIFSFLAIIFLGHMVYGSSFPDLNSLVSTIESHSVSIDDILEPWQNVIVDYNSLSSDFESIKEKHYGPYEPWEAPIIGKDGIELFFTRLWGYLKFIADVFVNTTLSSVLIIIKSIFAFLASAFILIGELVWLLVGVKDIFFGGVGA